MDAFEKAVEAYMRRTYPALFVEGHEYKNFNVSHEAEWSNDSGTSWPEDVSVQYDDVSYGTKGQKHTRRRDLSVGGNVVEFMRALFNTAEED